MEHITPILEAPLNLAISLAIVAAVIVILVHVVLNSGREFKWGKFTIIPARTDNDFATADNLPHSFQREMVSDLKETYKRKVDDIRNLSYKEAMNWENDFLKRVSALYKGADKVFAITLSSISDFWVSETDRQLILKYLKCQEGIEIHRLFVFESPYDLMRYEEVLKSNHYAYGNHG